MATATLQPPPVTTQEVYDAYFTGADEFAPPPPTPDESLDAFATRVEAARDDTIFAFVAGSLEATAGDRHELIEELEDAIADLEQVRDALSMRPRAYRDRSVSVEQLYGSSGIMATTKKSSATKSATKAPKAAKKAAPEASAKAKSKSKSKAKA